MPLSKADLSYYGLTEFDLQDLKAPIGDHGILEQVREVVWRYHGQWGSVVVFDVTEHGHQSFAIMTATWSGSAVVTSSRMPPEQFLQELADYFAALWASLSTRERMP